jgi:hypothetical protein
MFLSTGLHENLGDLILLRPTAFIKITPKIRTIPFIVFKPLISLKSLINTRLQKQQTGIL